MISEEDVFEYLNNLRQSGVTNMFAAPQYLMKVFHMDRDTAMKHFVNWTRTFDEPEVVDE